MENPPIKNYSFKHSFVKGEFFGLSWEGLERLVSAANVFLMLRILSLHEFGIYQLVLAFYSIVTTFSVDSIHEVVANDMNRFLNEKKLEQYRHLFSEYALLRVVLGAITALVVFLFANLIGARYGEAITSYIRVIALLFLLEGFRKPLFTVLKAHLYFGISTGQALIVASVKLIGFIILIKLGSFNILTVVIVHVFGYTVSTAVMSWFFLVKLRHSFTWKVFGRSKVIWAIVRQHGKWAIAGEQISRFTQNIRPWLINYLLNPSAVAIFSLALGLVGMLNSFLPLRTFSTLIPRELADKRRLHFIYRNSVKFVGLAGMAIAVVAFFVFPPVIKLILPKYAVSFPYFKLLLFVLLPLAGFSYLTRAILVALREQKVLFTRPLLQFIPTVIFSFLLIPKLGLWGAAIEYTITFIFLAVVLYTYLARVVPELRLNFWELVSLNRDDWRFIQANSASVWKEVTGKVFKKLEWRNS